MRHGKSFHRVVSLILCAVGAPCASPQAPAPASAAPQYSFGPVTEYDSATPNFNDALRFRRGERYNAPLSSLPGLGEDSEPQLWELTMHFRKDPMPFAASDAMVIGTVSAGQAFLSNDRRDIYSEFKLKLHEIFKAPNGILLQAGDSIDLQRKGGVIRLPSGKLIVRGVSSDSMPQVGKKYLLFLNYNREMEDYGILTGYQLAGKDVYRLDDLNDEESNHQEIIHPLHNEGVSEEQFLDRAKSKLPRAAGGALNAGKTPGWPSSLVLARVGLLFSAGSPGSVWELGLGFSIPYSISSADLKSLRIALTKMARPKPFRFCSYRKQG